MRIGVLTNLRAGRVSASAERVRRLLVRHPDVWHRETHGPHEVEAALAAFAADGVELLVVHGGDGTLQRVATRIVCAAHPGWSPLVAPLRGGRTNTSALSMGAHRRPDRGLAAILEAVRADTLAALVHERPVMRADLGARGVHCGFFFGAGILHAAIRATHSNFPRGRAQGFLGAALTTSALLGRAVAGRYGGLLMPEKVEVAVDGVAVRPREFLIVMATTLDRLFMRMNPFWGTGSGPLRFTTLAARPRGVVNTFRILSGRPPSHADEGYISENVERVALRLDGGFTIDGELFEPEAGCTVRLDASERLRLVIA